jgi:hypothetical protein
MSVSLSTASASSSTELGPTITVKSSPVVCHSHPTLGRSAKHSYPFRCLLTLDIIWAKRHVVRQARRPTLLCLVCPSCPERCHG